MPSPRERRLLTDFGKVNKLVLDSGGTLSLIQARGNPPTAYVIEYHCPSLTLDSSNGIIQRNSHRVEINLGANYPLEKPTARMLTPVFNPHVFLNNAICLGVVWSAAETLDALILRIGAILQLDPKVLDPNSPANIDANLWVKTNQSKIPLGKVGFRSSSEPAKRIQWID
jgi:ubiquitin-protein ligase